MRLGRIILVLLAGLLVYLGGRWHGSHLASGLVTQDSSAVHYDSAKAELLLLPYPVTDTLKVPPRPIDTEAVVKAHFRERKYLFQADTNDVRIQASGAIWRNELDTFQISIQNLRPTKMEYYRSAPKHRIGAGLIMAPQMAAPMLQYSYGRFQASVGYSLTGQQGWAGMVSYTLAEF